MKKLTLALSGLVLAACAGPQQEQAAGPRTIEPAASGSSRDDEAASDFVLSRKATKSKPIADEPTPIHLADDWWRFRGEFLRMPISQIRERDAEISERQPPPQFWDQQTAVEAASVWGSLCNECHGGRRAVRDAMNMPPPPSSWGRGTGLFFGQRKSYEALFAIVSGGGPERNGKKSEMPAWRGRLAREQIWAILYFLEFQSGGIEGRFPPSLYPRQSGDNN
jgi:hypothetical protein